MAKKIEIKFAGEDYTLVYTLDSIRTMERAGFDIDRASNMPVTSAEALLTGAFVEHHGRAIKNGIPEKIVKNGVPKKLLNALIEMYREALEMYFKDDDEDGEDGEKNLVWEKNF